MSDERDNSEREEFPEIGEEELGLRVIYSLLGPAGRIATRFGVSLKGMTSLLEMACYHQLKNASMTLREAADVLDISRRKVAQLSKQLKQNFFDPERHHGLPRRIEYMLWAGEMTEGRIRQALSDHSEIDIDAALDTLVDQERVLVSEDGYTKTYTVPESEFRLYANNWVARIDGLNNLLSNLADAVVGRFFEDDERVFVRTLNFRIRKEDISELHALYEYQIFETLSRLEQEAVEDEDSEVVDMSLSALWAPSDLANSNE